MSQGLLIFIAIGAVLAYLLIGFIGKLEDTDERLMTEDKMILKEDRKSYRKDLAGNTILVFKGLSEAQKTAIWERSPLHKEFLELFPDFSEMKHYVNDRVFDDAFKKKLMKRIDEAETGYFSGSMDEVQAKEKLDDL